jgi:hypothetical protein
MGNWNATAQSRAAMAIGALGLVFAACSDSTAPSGPVDDGPTIEVSTTQLAQSQLVVDDVTARLIPSIANQPGTLELSAAVSALSLAVLERNADDVEENVARARTALAQVRQQSTDAQTADLDAIELAILDAERLLTYPTP